MIFLAIAVIILIIGLVVKFKKTTWLISGYNTASKAKQAEYDKDKLIKYFSGFLFVLAGTYFLWGIILLFLPQYTELLFWLGFGSSFIVIIVGIIYLNAGDKLKNNKLK